MTISNKAFITQGFTIERSLWIYIMLFFVPQYEAKIKSLTETIQDVDIKKRQLEDSLDLLNEKLSTAQAAGKYIILCLISL